MAHTKDKKHFIDIYASERTFLNSTRNINKKL